MNETATMTCPKCQGQMRSYERNGIQVDQCSECRGIFLDRGELERLIEAENAYLESAPAGGERSGLGSGHGFERDSRKGGERKRQGMLSEMLEGLGG